MAPYFAGVCARAHTHTKKVKFVGNGRDAFFSPISIIEFEFIIFTSIIIVFIIMSQHLMIFDVVKV